MGFFDRFSDPYIISEIGVNHENDIFLAKKMIQQSSKAGASAVKFQTYKANKIASKQSPYYWDLKEEKTKSQFELFEKYDKFNEKEYKILFNEAKKNKIDFLSTPFDNDSVDFLNKYLRYYKISSSDLNNFNLLDKIASKKKPIILSTGAANLGEIELTLKFLEKRKVKDICLLHCILNYPTNDFDSNLNIITELKINFPKYHIGISDHTVPNDSMNILVYAYILGAKIIEKHFTHNKKLKGNDHYHSMDFKDLKKLNEQITIAKKIIGKKTRKVNLSIEKKSRKNARRSICIFKSIKKNTIIKESHLIPLRPENGISVSSWYDVIGLKVNTNLKKGAILKWKYLEKK